MGLDRVRKLVGVLDLLYIPNTSERYLNSFEGRQEIRDFVYFKCNELNGKLIFYCAVSEYRLIVEGEDFKITTEAYPEEYGMWEELAIKLFEFRKGTKRGKRKDQERRSGEKG